MRSNWVLTMFLVFLFFVLLSLGYAQNYSSPESTFETFKEAAGNADNQKYVACTTKESQAMLNQRGSNPTQLQNEYKALAGKEYRIDIKGDSATLYFIPEDEYNPPYFFKNENGQWKIDLKSMSDKIYFDNENKWHLRK